jgi:hypothetical protein
VKHSIHSPWLDLERKALAKLSILFHHAKVFSPCIASWQYSRFQIEPSGLMVVVYQIWNRIRSLVLFKFLQCFKEILERKFWFFHVYTIGSCLQLVSILQGLKKFLLFSLTSSQIWLSPIVDDWLLAFFSFHIFWGQNIGNFF